MMLPVSRFKGQPVGMITTTTPWLYVSSDPIPHWLSLASLSAATYPATPPLVFYPPAVWIPENTHLIQVTHTCYTPDNCFCHQFQFKPLISLYVLFVTSICFRFCFFSCFLEMKHLK